MYLLANKKGISEIISYVLLIVIAIGIFTIVAVFLQLQVPKFQIPECEQDISLILQDYTCTPENLTLTLLNKGFFSVDAAFIRFGNESQKVKELLNNESVYFVSDWIGTSLFAKYVNGTRPGDSWYPREHYDISHLVGDEGTYVLEIEPAMLNKNNELALCPEALISKKIFCGVPSCGNGTIDSDYGEDCEPGDLNGQTCVSQGFTGMGLDCYSPGHSSECTFDSSACSPPIP